MLQSLNGHPDSGTNWEIYADEGITRAGFVLISKEWQSCYFHPKLRLMLVVYVDDFKLSGPKNNLAKGWALLRSKNVGNLSIEKEVTLDEKGVTYLGCRQVKTRRRLPDGGLATVMEYDMEEFFAIMCREVQGVGWGKGRPSVPHPFHH